MLECTVKVGSKSGIHGRVAYQIVNCLNNNPSTTLRLFYKNEEIDVTSILQLLTLAIPCGESLRLLCAGTNAKQVLEEIASIICDDSM